MSDTNSSAHAETRLWRDRLTQLGWAGRRNSLEGRALHFQRSMWAFFYVALALSLQSCASRPHQPPNPPAVDPSIYAHDCKILYNDELGRDPDASGLFACETRLAARSATGAVLETQEQFRAWLRMTEEYKARQERLRVKPLPRLVIRGGPGAMFFGLEGGARFTVIAASDFLLYQRFLDGQDIRPVLDQRVAAGFNMVRVFGMVNGSLGRFLPGAYGGRYYDSLPAFSLLLAASGLYVEFTAFADATQAMPTIPDQLAHWQRLVGALRPLSNVFLEVGNELDQPINRLDSVALLPRPTGLMVAHGSNGSQAWPVQPYWDYLPFHSNDAPEWPRKVGHNCWEIDFTRPCLANENTRAPDRLTSTAQAYDAAAGAALLAAGSTFHSVHGRSSELWNTAELALAKAWADGARSVPLSCQDGPYRHRIDLEGPDDLRVYQRGDDPACIVRIRR